jgi:putative transcriptional regulator
MSVSKPNLDAMAADAQVGPGSASIFPEVNSAGSNYLTNQFLIAMPGMLDEQFAGSVVYLFEHNAKGAMGLVVNRPTEVTLLDLLEKIELAPEGSAFSEQAVYFGGPVQVERGFVLHDSPSPSYSSSLTVPQGLTMTTSKDVLEAVASGSGPNRFIMTLGYAGWSAGQLEEEIALNGWINAKLSREQIAEIVFATPASQRYQRTMNALGFDPADLSGQVGHA